MYIYILHQQYALDKNSNLLEIRTYMNIHDSACAITQKVYHMWIDCDV